MSRRSRTHREVHNAANGAWLRAAVLGADDGVVSTASLVLGVSAASASKEATLVAGVAGLVAGALSMAAGEYVSVSSQRDAEQADVAREKEELATDPSGELKELAGIYRKRGLDAELAMRVAEKLSANDRLGSHLRDELGLDEARLARPIQAAAVSAASFSSLALVPIVTVLIAPESLRLPLVGAVCLVSLGALGALGGYLGGAPMTRASLRVMIGGGAAMAVTALIGHLLRVVGVG
ncbi:MAG: VIT family protein [Polyangiaceae bacterium]